MKLRGLRSRLAQVDPVLIEPFERCPSSSKIESTIQASELRDYGASKYYFYLQGESPEVTWTPRKSRAGLYVWTGQTLVCLSQEDNKGNVSAF
jgi:hypothetical protein